LAPLADDWRPLDEHRLDNRLGAAHDQAVAGAFVVELFAIPLVVAVAVVAVKLLEFALNRDIASTKAVARNTTLFVFVTTVLALLAWYVYVVIAIHNDRAESAAMAQGQEWPWSGLAHRCAARP
jgi:hypothetical protein